MDRITRVVAVAMMMGCAVRWAFAGEEQGWGVGVAKDGFTAAQVAEVRGKWSWEDCFRVGDNSLYAFLHYGEFYPSAVIHRAGAVGELEREIDPRVGEMRWREGAASLGEYLGKPGPRAQGMIVVRRGTVVFEAYPGMRETDSHCLFSVGKTAVSLVLGQMEDEGKVDVQKTVGEYLPLARGTDWEGVRVIDVLDMASGMDVLESGKNREDVTTAFGRFVRAIFNVPGEGGKVESENEVLRSAKKLRGAGEVFQYSSLNTQVLVLLTEAVEGRPWQEIFERRVWSKMSAEGDANVLMTPDGTAMPMGFVSMRLRDLARYGMLYTPSWPKAARERVVSDAMIEKIQKGGREGIFTKAMGEGQAKQFGDAPVATTRQWDTVFGDGDFCKTGLAGQGLYVSPGKDVVVAWFSTTGGTELGGYARRIAVLYVAGRERESGASSKPAGSPLK